MLARQARNPRSLAGRLWMSDVFDHHPYGRSASGTPASVKAIGRADLADLAARQFRRDGLVIGAVGDITPQELAAVIDRVFGALPQGGPDMVIPEASLANAGDLVVSRAPVPQSAVTFGQAGPKRDDPDWYAALVLNEILGGGGFRGRLMKEIREKRGLAYGVSTDLVPYPARSAALPMASRPIWCRTAMPG
jgi:zinc protease